MNEDGRTDRQTNGQIDRWMNGWMDGQTDRQMGGPMDGQTDPQIEMHGCI